MPLGIAIGVAMIKPGDNPKLVVENADKEMYRMKRQVSARREVPPKSFCCTSQPSPLDRDLDLVGAAAR